MSARQRNGFPGQQIKAALRCQDLLNFQFPTFSVGQKDIASLIAFMAAFAFAKRINTPTKAVAGQLGARHRLRCTCV